MNALDTLWARTDCVCIVLWTQRGGSAKEKEKKLRMLSDQKRRVENVNVLIEYHMRKFEEFRLLKMKVRLQMLLLILLDVCCCQWHKELSFCFLATENHGRTGALQHVLPREGARALLSALCADLFASGSRTWRGDVCFQLAKLCCCLRTDDDLSLVLLLARMVSGLETRTSLPRHCVTLLRLKRMPTVFIRPGAYSYLQQLLCWSRIDVVSNTPC